MSFETIRMAWEAPIQNPNTKYVLLAIADCVNDETGDCFPSVSLLAQKTSLSRSSVKRALLDLMESGMVSCDARVRSNGSRSSNRYVISFRQQDDVVEPPGPDPRVGSIGTGGGFCVDRGVGPIGTGGGFCVNHPYPIILTKKKESLASPEAPRPIAPKTPEQHQAEQFEFPKQFGFPHEEIPPGQKVPVRSPRQQARDLLLCALGAIEMGVPPSSIKTLSKAEARRHAKALQAILEITPDATQDEIVRRAACWASHMGRATLTSNGLAKHWRRLEREAPPSREDIRAGRLTDGQRRQLEHDRTVREMGRIAGINGAARCST